MTEQTQTNGETAPETPKQLPTVIQAGAAVKSIVPVSIEDTYRMARAFANSGLVPKEYQREPDKAFAAICLGLEVGLPPMTALKWIAVINGKPALYGDGQMAVAQGSGKLEKFIETIEGEGDDMVAVCRVRRTGDDEDTVRTFSVDDAKTAGLWEKQGPWTQYPKRMLQMRARGFALRDKFADALGGLGQSVEELRDMGDLVEAEDGAFVPRPTRAADAPDRPTRTSSATDVTNGGSDETVIYTLVNGDGEVEMETAFDGEWGDALVGLLTVAEAPAAYDAIVAANQDQIDAMPNKVALPQRPAPHDSEPTDHDIVADDIINEIAAAKTADRIAAILRENGGDMDSLQSGAHDAWTRVMDKAEARRGELNVLAAV